MAVKAQVSSDELEQQAYFRREDLTDGLPIIVPTPERVDNFLEANGFAPHRHVEIGQIPPLELPVTIEDVAINTLMAGARPQDLGVVLGAIEAMLQPAFRLSGVQATTNPCTPLVIVNGPVVDELELGSGNHAFGPGRHPNGAIGRAIRFVQRNLGGATDEIDRSSFGQPAKYTCLIAEAEAKSPWEPYHVSRGYREDQSVVTVSGMENLMNVVLAAGRHVPISGPFFHQFGRLMHAIGTNIWGSAGSPVFILSPGQAVLLAGEGYDRKRLQEELFEVGKIPLEEYPYGNFPKCEWKAEDGKILPCQDADDIRIFVAGGGEALHSLYAQSFMAIKACSAEVWTPDRLD
jgi:hypothetical protein